MMAESTERSTDKRIANLKPAWEKGQSGNPKGRKPGSINITNIIKRKLKEVAPGDPKGRKYLELVAESLILNTIKGNGTAIKQIMDRVDGVIADKHEHSGPNGGPIKTQDVTAEMDPEERRRLLEEYANR